MSIVIITIPGNAQKNFINTLYRKTKGGVKLVIIQNPKKQSFFKRLIRFFSSIKLSNIFREIWYALKLRLDPRIKKALSYFQAPNIDDKSIYLPEVIWTDSINDDIVYEKLKIISPKVLAVWGSAILKQHIIDTAKNAVNLHFGHSPQYRGALANQHALINEDYKYIGATIHYMRNIVDGGDILEQLTLDTKYPPSKSFPALTTQAYQRFIDVIKDLYEDRKLPVRTQNTEQSKILFLSQWIPSLRYKVGKKILELEKNT